MSSAFHIRRVESDDGPAIRELVFGVLTEFGLKPDPGGTDRDLADIDSAYNGRGGIFLVIESAEGEVVGCGGLYPLEAGESEIRKMYLLPATRGHGLGKRLLEQLIDAARERGFKRVIVETADVLQAAVALYRARGFSPIQRQHLPERCDQALALEL